MTRTVSAEPIADLGRLPFHVSVSEGPSNGDFPDVLPFCIGVSPDVSLLVQCPNSQVAHWLDRAYEKGAVVGTPLCGWGLGREYTDDFASFLLRALRLETMAGLRVLEIGCGGGYLLSRLSENGAEVLGVEPGPQGQMGARKYGVEILRGVFPSEEVLSRGRFDLIILYGVLEHVADPVDFMRSASTCLADSGMVAVSVPDCGECIRVGDISMLLHQHWSYFSLASLCRVMQAASLHIVRLDHSGVGDSIYGAGAPTARSQLLDMSHSDDFSSFLSSVRRGIRRAAEFFDRTAQDHLSTGVFCAGRAINLLHVTQPRSLPRFFDDDVRLLGKYYPPLDVPVESRASLLAKPVSELLVMSRPFGAAIQSTLLEQGLGEDTNVWLPQRFFDGSHTHDRF